MDIIGTVTFVIIVLALGVALQRADRRAANGLPRVVRGDRDAERVRAELAARDRADQEPRPRVTPHAAPETVSPRAQARPAGVVRLRSA